MTPETTIRSILPGPDADAVLEALRGTLDAAREMLADVWCPATGGGTEGKWCMNHDAPMADDGADCAIAARWRAALAALPDGWVLARRQDAEDGARCAECGHETRWHMDGACACEGDGVAGLCPCPSGIEDVLRGFEDQRPMRAWLSLSWMPGPNGWHWEVRAGRVEDDIPPMPLPGVTTHPTIAAAARKAKEAMG